MHLRRRLARSLIGLALAVPALVTGSTAAQTPPLPGLDDPDVGPPTAPPDSPPAEEPPPPTSPPAEEPPPPDSPPAEEPAEPPDSASELPPADPGPELEPPPAPPPTTPVPPISPAPTPTPTSPVPSDSPTKPVPSDSQAKPALSDSPAPRDDPKRWRHAGFILDLQVGTGGCTRRFCSSSSGHDAAPGLRLGGFVGGNIWGILEVGLAAGWNTLRPRGVTGENAMTLYDLDPAKVEAAIAKEQGVPALAIDLSSLTVQTASSRAFDIGPSLRVHFIRKGRGIAYAGADIHYQLWRNRYTTASGDLRLTFHGVSAPLRVGGGAYVHRNIAIVGEFSYVLSAFVVGGIRHPLLNAVAPLQALESTAAGFNSDHGTLKGGLPRFWNLSVNLRFRF
ncbi:MAG: hypothetical protein IPO88_02270 [Nannocystis sp.]|uniref:hypothetical protein n=1 Tax=Nannocystis sp. TaxID=1962667 RepID=UPI002427FE48|nr:hypothetical protein [Nannocystis sp.]MBK9752328.1 hypothetical protein [Nannocystis sp.]